MSSWGGGAQTKDGSRPAVSQETTGSMMCHDGKGNFDRSGISTDISGCSHDNCIPNKSISLNDQTAVRIRPSARSYSHLADYRSCVNDRIQTPSMHAEHRIKPTPVNPSRFSSLQVPPIPHYPSPVVPPDSGHLFRRQGQSRHGSRRFLSVQTRS